MESKQPLVSVIMPTYNRVGLLERAVNSVLRQSLEEIELIIINDASTDGTHDFLEALAKKDARVKLIHHEKNNYPDISKTLNEGLVRARGKYIARLDDDDYWCDNDKLKKQYEFLELHPDHVVVGGGTIVVDENDKERFRYQKIENDAQIRDKALFANPFTHSAVMFRRDVAIGVGGYGNFKNAEDWSLWLAMGLRGKFHNLQEYFVRYLMTDQNKSFVFKRSQAKEILNIVLHYRKEYPNFWGAYLLSLGQYYYSLLPYGLRRALYHSLSKAKRSLFSN